MQEIADKQAGAITAIDENFESIEYSQVYGKNPETTEALTWGSLPGRWGGIAYAGGTHTLSNGTNYQTVLRSTGVPDWSTAATHWDDTVLYGHVYKITVVGGVVTAVEDHRAGVYGIHGPSGAEVIGPNSSTDNAVARFGGATGRLLQDGPVTIDDDGNVDGIENLSAESLTLEGAPITATAAQLNIAALTAGLEPSLDLLFAADKSLAPHIGAATLSFTRSTSGWYWDASGALTEATSDEPRFDHDPASLMSRGLSVEGQRTNRIRNSTMAGANPATETPPTNWTVSSGGVTLDIVGVGTEDMIPYMDVRWSGTGAGAASRTYFDTTISASVGQTWVNSFFCRLVAGSLANTNIRLESLEYNASASLGAMSSSTFTPTPTPLRTQRRSLARTLTDGTVNIVRPALRYTFTGAVDITLRVGLPQMELGELMSSPIRTSSAAVTRNADACTTPNLGILPSAGTVIIAAQTPPGAGVQTLWGLSDGTADERIYIVRNASREIHAVVVTGGVEQANLNLGAVNDGTNFRVAFAWQANNVAASLNGGGCVTDGSAALPVVNIQEWGHDHAAANHWNSTIARHRSFPQRLPNPVLQALSST